MDRGLAGKFAAALVLAALVLGAFSVPLGPLPPLGSLLDPTAGVWTVPTRARHPAASEVSVPGLGALVTVLRDVHGIPHIYADDGPDAWFALGYVHAQDRLFQMDIQARAGAGRLSEVLGPSFLETDRFLRTIGLNRIARDVVAARTAAGGLDVEVLQAYADGVNAYLSSLARADLPLEFKLLGYAPEPWSPERTVLLGLLIAFELSWDTNDVEYALVEAALGPAAAEALFPAYPAGPQTPIVPGIRSGPASEPLDEASARDLLRRAAAAKAALPGVGGSGSNNWAVAGSRTASGKPLLAADPHLAFTLPSVWYWAELHGRPYHVRGATFPGVPAFFFGTNGRIAWGETNTGADVTDYYVETMSADGSRYLFQGEWRDVEVIDEPIAVRGRGVDPFQVRATQHGPILTVRGQALAMRSTLAESGGEFEAMLRINLASTWTEFRDALRTWRVPAQNFVYADGSGAQGTIAIRTNGAFPMRDGDVVPRVPLNGSSGDHEWIGHVPFDAAPELVNPPEGFVASANQVPAGPRYSYYLGTFWAEGYRARRITALLSADASVTFEDLRGFQLDVGDVAAEAFVPLVLNAVNAFRSNSPDLDAIAALLAWDRRMTTDSVAATIWWTFLEEYRMSTFGDEYAAAGLEDVALPYVVTLEAMSVNSPDSPWFDDVTTASVTEARDDIIRKAFVAAVDRLVDEMGRSLLGWTWGARHARTFGHLTGLEALSRGPFPSPGDRFTLNVAGGLTARGGPSWRQLIDFSDLNASQAIYPGGQSGNPVSPHYADLLGLYVDGRYLPFRGRWSASIWPASEIASTLRLLPGG